MDDDHSVVGRTVAILDAVSDAVAPLPLAVLTRRTQIPKPTVRRIANDLVARGMLQRTLDGYWTGPRLMTQGVRAMQQRGLHSSTQPYVQELYLRSRGGIGWFANFYGGEVIMIGAAFGRTDIGELHTAQWPSVATVGPQFVLTVAGRIHVSGLPDQSEVLARPGLRPLTRYSVTDPAKLARLVAEARDTGFGVEEEQVKLGTSCAAVAVRDGSGEVTGALGVTVRGGGVALRTLKAPLVAFADNIRRDAPAWS